MTPTSVYDMMVIILQAGRGGSGVRYSKDHKQETRKQIVRAARQIMQTDGIEGTSIPAVMGAAGLTHGGFYAYFPSKTDLVAEVCTVALARRTTLLGEAAQAGQPGTELATYIDYYLGPEHSANRGGGCILPALTGDVTRAEPAVRHALTEAVRGYAHGIAGLLPAGDPDREDEALVLAAGMAGAVMLARTVDDPALGDRILAAARRFYRQTFTPDVAQGGA
ncbi:MAG TPA: TetR/AcrR family transcriptional regulator [Chloroflexia bacterium]|nr:TetR/AcrR family transcriptional regulator [Chloroflexia bacterium]